MNKIKATVLDIQNSDILNIVSFKFGDFILSMMSLEVENVKKNSNVILSAKPSSVAIGKDFNGQLSYSNQLKGKITNVQNGELLSFVEVKVVDTIIQSVITKKSSKRLNLKPKDEVICIIKASDLSILEVYS